MISVLDDSIQSFKARERFLQMTAYAETQQLKLGAVHWWPVGKIRSRAVGFRWYVLFSFLLVASFRNF